MQAITVKFLASTCTKGTRYKATAAADSVTLSADYALTPEQNAKLAAQALIAKLSWPGKWAIGYAADGTWQAVCYSGGWFDITAL
jgi:hypothetical protein